MKARLNTSRWIGFVSLVSLAIVGALPTTGGAEDPGAATASRLTPKNGVYRGKTAQGGPVSFRVRKGRVERAAYTIYNRGCGVKITFPISRKVNRKSRFFFGRKSSDFFTGKFATPGKVRGKAGIDFSDSACPGRGVREVRFRAKRVRVR